MTTLILRYEFHHKQPFFDYCGSDLLPEEGRAIELPTDWQKGMQRHYASTHRHAKLGFSGKKRVSVKTKGLNFSGISGVLSSWGRSPPHTNSARSEETDLFKQCVEIFI